MLFLSLSHTLGHHGQHHRRSESQAGLRARSVHPPSPTYHPYLKDEVFFNPTQRCPTLNPRLWSFWFCPKESPLHTLQPAQHQATDHTPEPTHCAAGFTTEGGQTHRCKIMF